MRKCSCRGSGGLVFVKLLIFLKVCLIFCNCLIYSKLYQIEQSKYLVDWIVHTKIKSIIHNVSIFTFSWITRKIQITVITVMHTHSHTISYLFCFHMIDFKENKKDNFKFNRPLEFQINEIEGVDLDTFGLLLYKCVFV